MKNLSSKEINLLRQNARSAVRELGLLNDAYFEIGVTLAERHLLIELASCEGSITAKEIAERLLLDKSTISRLVSKSVKKGYITCSTDKKDKRKRFLHFTEKGKKTLNAFESIAYNQTKEALQTLRAEEIKIVYQGVALYAQGLTNSRLKNAAITSSCDNKPIGSLEDLYNQLHLRGYKLKSFNPEDEQALYEIFKEVVDSGDLFPYRNSSIEEFRNQFFGPTSKVYVCRSPDNSVIGGFYLKPNFPGRSSHIANAAYMIKSTHRGQGIGSLLIKASLHIAKSLRFQSMQFNLVLSQNHIAIKLYQKLGFNTLGVIPKAIQNPDNSFQDGYIMHRELDVL